MKHLVLLPLLALAASAGETPAAAPKGGDAALGKTLFAAKCVTCHAKDAKGNPAMAKMFKVDAAKLDLTGEPNQKKTDAELTKVLNDGNGKMPSFKGKLKDADIADAIAYLRSLKAPAVKTGQAKK